MKVTWRKHYTIQFLAICSIALASMSEQIGLTGQLAWTWDSVEGDTIFFRIACVVGAYALIQVAVHVGRRS